MREQTLATTPSITPPLDVTRWFVTELLKFEGKISKRFPEREAVLHILSILRKMQNVTCFCARQFSGFWMR